jgi:hypothetical protein
MHRNNISGICKNVICLFAKTVVCLDKTTKFVKRKSKLGARLFVEVLVSGCLLDPTISLERLCKLLKQRGIRISKQGLQQRFNTVAAKKLMQIFFLKALEKFKTKNSNVFSLLKHFSTVNIVDSSGISLPSHLKDLYKGTGGVASEAGMKIQVLFDYINGYISQLKITEGRTSDQGYDKYLSKIEKGALHLQDLGYFKLKSFIAIHQKGAYFISRYFNATKVFDKDGKQMGLIKVLQKAGRIFEKQVWLGQTEKMKVRLVAYRLSDEDAGKRIYKIKRAAQRSGKHPTKEALRYARWSIYITNVPEDKLKVEQIHLVYTLRWQVELFFRLCKSGAGIDKVNGRNVNRILCEIYAKLSCVVMLLYFCFPLRWQKNCELSLLKAYKELQQRAVDFFRALTSLSCMIKFMKILYDDLKDFAYKDKNRIKGRLVYQRLMDAAGQEVLV